MPSVSPHFIGSYHTGEKTERWGEETEEVGIVGVEPGGGE